MRKKPQNQKGFALIETLFGISIFVLVVIALTLFSRNIWIYGSYISTGLSDANNGKTALKRMVAELRTASTAENGAYVINSATATSFIFYSDIDGDGLAERVRYFLNGSQLEKGIIKPSGNPLSYNPANEVVAVFVPSVVNGTIFEYYDRNYDGTTAPLSLPINISAVRLVKITISIDKDLNKPPGANTFSTQVSIRNLKDNL